MATPSRPAPSSPAGRELWAGPCLSACRLAPWVTSPSLPQDKGHRNLRTALQLTPQNPPTAFASGHPHWPSPFSVPFPPTSPAGLAVPGSDRNLGTQPWVSALDLGLRTAGPAPALPGSSCKLGPGAAGPQHPPPRSCAVPIPAPDWGPMKEEGGGGREGGSQPCYRCTNLSGSNRFIQQQLGPLGPGVRPGPGHRVKQRGPSNRAVTGPRALGGSGRQAWPQV